ncbi:thiamine phosphate synthase [Mucilaginibacter lacusdianchii]|uniref:thiamine phosphate synthase n=1 Tax=Mucilaginibacter lacusdianchii TaxID=2684211 RepID=UPI001E3473EC|nr:thiamine phosphate synthase [Mucilaginibacter sp. JXJ CY 39]
MTHKPYEITGGIYLVINPAIEITVLLDKLASALAGGIKVVQIWNNWPPDINKLGLIEKIARLCIPYQVPLLINQEWPLLLQTHLLQGVHFDDIHPGYEAIKEAVGRPFLAGITSSDSTRNAIWAHENGLDYISFCSMFPSPSAGSCDIVMPATVREARKLTQLPIFVSGGITPENITSLKKETPFDGVAVISGLLSADNPKQKVQEYKNALGINNNNYEIKNH